MEVSIRFGDEPEEIWIPLTFIYIANGVPHDDIKIGTEGNLTIRGYSLIEEKVKEGANYSNVSIQICDSGNLSRSVQFRWLQTSRQRSSGQTNIIKDMWTLDDVNIGYEHSNGEKEVILEESFSDDQLE